MIKNIHRPIALMAILLLITLLGSLAAVSHTNAGGDNSLYLPVVTKPLRYWIRIYTGAPNEAWASLHAIDGTSDGGYIAAGEVDRLSPDHSGAWLLKLNQDGSVDWDITVEKGKRAFYAAETQDSGFIMAGQSSSLGAGKQDAWIMKVDEVGRIVWQKSYGGSEMEWLADSVVETTDGNLFLAGTTESFGIGYKDIWVLKLRADGSAVWAKSYGTEGIDEARSVAVTADGGLIIAWSSLITRLDNAGNVRWTNSYSGNSVISIFAIRQSRDGGFVAAGWNGVVLKIDASGHFSWAKQVVWGDPATFLDVWESAAGDLYLAGDTHTDGYKAILLKMNRDGDVLWFHGYGGADANHFNSIRQLANGDLIAAGTTMSYNPEERPPEAWVVKMDEDGLMDGCQDWESVNPTITDLEFTPNARNLTVLTASGILQDTSAVSYEESTTTNLVCPANLVSPTAPCP